MKEQIEEENELLHIKRLVSEVSGVDNFDVKSRKRNLVYLRYVYFDLCRKFTDFPLAVIGDYCGDRDHSTVICALNEFDYNYDKNWFSYYKNIHTNCSNQLKFYFMDSHFKNELYAVMDDLFKLDNDSKIDFLDITKDFLAKKKESVKED